MKIRIDDSHLYTVLKKLNNCLDYASDAKTKSQSFFGLISFDAYSANNDFKNAKVNIKSLLSELNNLRDDFIDYRNEVDNIIFDTPELVRGENENRRVYNARKRESDNTEEQIASGELVRLHDGTVVDPDSQSVVQLSDGDYALANECVTLNGEYELKENCYQLYDGSYALKADCTLVYADCYVLSPEPLSNNPTDADYQRYATDWMNIYGDLAKQNGTTVSEEFWKDKADDWRSPVNNSEIEGGTAGLDSAGRQFGSTRSNGRYHAGFDINLPKGAEVKSMTGGYVIDINYNFYDGTDAVTIRNDDGSIVRYCEIDCSVKEGDRVSAGDVLGEIEQHKSGTCLHMEVYAGTEKYDKSFNETGTAGSTGYDYVGNKNYKRRDDLLDPTGVKKLL